MDTTGNNNRSLRQVIISLSLLFGLLVVGTVVFRLLNPAHTWFDALYETANILTTVGDTDKDYNQAQRIWALILMLAAISAALYAAATVVASLVEGEMKHFFGKRKVQTMIGRQQNHYIICGFGRMGEALCQRLKAQNVPFVLIEQDARGIKQADELGYLYIEGDAMTEQALSLARLEDARGLATCLPSDADNVFVTLTARGLNEKLTIIARAESLSAQSKLHRAGADSVICPPVLGATRIAQMMLHPAAGEFLEWAVSSDTDLDISRVHIRQLPGAIGKTLRQLELPAKTGLMVIAVNRGARQRHFNPPPDWRFEADDELTVTGPSSGMTRLMELMGESPSHPG